MKCDSINFMLFFGWPDHYEIASDAPAHSINNVCKKHGKLLLLCAYCCF